MSTPRWHDAPSALSPRTVDLLLAAAVAITLAVVITLSVAGTGARPSVSAYVFALGFGAVLVVRRQFPVAVLVVSVLGTFAYYTLGYPPIGVALPIVVALYSAAEFGLLAWAISSGVVVVGVSLFFRIRDDPFPVGYLLGADALSNLALVAAAIALGYAIRSRRLWAAEQEQVARLTREQAVREAELRAQVERERISRDLHDTVGHALSVIALQASVGREAVGADDAAVAAALEQVRGQSSTSLAELRSMVRLLRAGAEDDGRQVRSLVDLPGLVTEAEAAGVAVRSEIDLAGADLPSAVDTAAYRVVQESLTNVLRHADAHSARVVVRGDADRLSVTVSDDGRGAADDLQPGFGLAGMAERVRLLGGSFSTRGEPGVGFTVRAELPARLDP